MTALILLAIAVALVLAVTVDLTPARRDDALGARVAGDDKKRPQSAEPDLG